VSLTFVVFVARVSVLFRFCFVISFVVCVFTSFSNLFRGRFRSVIFIYHCRFSFITPILLRRRFFVEFVSVSPSPPSLFHFRSYSSCHYFAEGSPSSTQHYITCLDSTFIGLHSIVLDFGYTLFVCGKGFMAVPTVVGTSMHALCVSLYCCW